MANRVKSMNEIKQVLRLRYECGESIKAIARQLGMSKNTVKDYLRRYEQTSSDLPDLLSKDPAELSFELRPPQANVTERYAAFLEQAEGYLGALQRNKHLTKQLLWEEEFTAGRIAYRYSQFCHYLQQYERQKAASMVMHYVPGDKLLIDFAGDKLSIVDRHSGELTPCEVLVMTLAYSHKTIIVALPNQSIEQLIYGVSYGLYQLGVAPKAIVCDNLKSAVTKSDRYEPVIQEAFLDMANHYGMSVLPTRVRKPKDKSRVEGAVNHIYYQVYARIRNHIYYSLQELNEALREMAVEFNQRIMKDYGLSRDALFERDERPCMKALPQTPYQLISRYKLIVGQNGHVHISSKKQYYSAPYRLIGQRVEVVYRTDVVKMYHQGECVATHAVTRQRYHTQTDHMASHHKAHLDGMNPEILEQRAKRIGEACQRLILRILSRNQHPEQNYKTCQGILALSDKSGAERLNQSCAFALENDLVNYNSVRRLCLSAYFDEQQSSAQTKDAQLPLHDNIRGASLYE
jgi:transposase